MHARRAIVAGLSAALAAPFALQAEPAYVLSGSNLLTLGVEAPQTLRSTLPIVGVSAGESLVGIDIRPQNGFLYALGVNATADTATLYALSRRTGFAAVVGNAASIAFVAADGTTPIDLPDPATTGWGFDFNPAADRLRVTAGSLNFRVDPNTGLGIDGNLGGGVVNGVNPDGPVNGGTTTVSSAAYTNNQPNNGNVTTLYTVDAAGNTLFIQNPPNNGTQTSGQSVLLSGNPIDFTAINGFDIAPGVNAPSSNAAVVTGSGYAALVVGGTSGLYRIALPTAQATLLGNVGNGAVAVHGLALQPVQYGVHIIGLSQTGPNLVRFFSGSPGAFTTQAISGISAGDVLAGIDFRPQTGQLYALGVNDGANTATLYRIDPQSGAAVAIGVPGGIAFVDTVGNPIDFPLPSSVDYGFDFNPTVDRIRVTAANGVNFRINPVTGGPVDGDTVAAGNQPDGNINGSGSAGVVGAAYTNNYGQSLTGGVTTLYTLDSAQNTLFIQNPPNAGVQTQGRVITVAGVPLDFTGAAGFDIPAAVRVNVSNVAAKGEGYAVLTVGGVSRLYAISLQSAAAIYLGDILTPLRGIAIADPELDILRDGFE